MVKKQDERCRWTTKKGDRCKRNAVNNTGLCSWHSISVSYKTHILFFFLGVLVTLVITALGPDIRDLYRRIVPEKRLIEKIKDEGNKALRTNDRARLIMYTHELYNKGIKALGDGDYNSYDEAIWQLLRLHEFYLTSDSSSDPTASLGWKEVSGQLISLITAKPLEFSHCVQIHFKLGEVALAGTKKSIIDYNKGKFFSDLLFTGTLELTKGIIDTLWAKNDYVFADLLSEIMMEVLVAEGHRRLDQGYRICPKPDDMITMTFTGECVADVGQPHELDSFYKTCYIISRLPGQLFKELNNTPEDYYKLSINAAETTEQKADSLSIGEIINRWKYYHPYSILVSIYSEKKPLLDSLIAVYNQKGSEATECVKQLLIRERNPKKWKESKFVE